MPLPDSRELREMLDEATPAPWESKRFDVKVVDCPKATQFLVSGEDQRDIAGAEVLPEYHDQAERNFTLIALAPQLAEEVIRLRDEIDRLKWYCLDGCRSAEAEEAHATGERRARAQGKQEAYYSTYLQITQGQHKENK